MDFKLGEIVYLNSGSPMLTITELVNNRTVHVTWCRGDGTSAEADFPFECVTREQRSPT